VRLAGKARIAAIATAVVCLGGAHAAPAAQAGAAPTPEEAEALGKQAYDYGFPLLEILRVRREQTSVECPDLRGNSPVNSFSHAGGFAGPADTTVVAPNTDTLYSIAHLDLKKGPVVIGHPDMGERYFSFALLDAYSNIIAIPGLRENGPDASRYAIRWRGSDKKPPKGTEVIRSASRRVWVIGRTLATDAADQAKAQKLMARYRLILPNGRERTFPDGCEPGAPSVFPTPTDGPGFVAALNKALAKNPPPKRDAPLLDELEPLGVGPGLDPEEEGLEPAVLAALYDGVAEEAAALPVAARVQSYTQSLATGGWLLPQGNIGDYGTDYAFRAVIAVVGLGANTPDEAIYPTALADSSGALFDGSEDYRLVFPPGEAPPAKYFWSLTMYDAAGYLVDNPINRYSLGPSHPPLLEQPDGSIVIAIQRTDPADSGVNWLPSPPGGFRLSLRLYGPSKAALAGDWRPPGVVRLGR
jgi:hypothetical protein